MPGGKGKLSSAANNYDGTTAFKQVKVINEIHVSEHFYNDINTSAALGRIFDTLEIISITVIEDSMSTLLDN